MESLPVKVLPYLLSSRYCEVDRLCDMAWKIFDQTPRGWGRVQAVCDWVHDHVRFGYEYARSTKSAYEVYQALRAKVRSQKSEVRNRDIRFSPKMV